MVLIRENGREDVTGKDDHGKTLEAVRKSRQIRLKIKTKLGCMPESILVNKRADKPIDLIITEGGRSYGEVKRRQWRKIKKNHPERKKDGRQATHLFKGTTSSAPGAGEKGALSSFSQNVGRIITLIYSPDGCTVYDPFAGHNGEMEMIWRTGRSYIGVDICKEFMDYNRKVRDILIKKEKEKLLESPRGKIILIEGNSNNVKELPDSCADFTITSPPYWNIEYYGPEKEQLGMNHTYKGFLSSLNEHIKENYRILKPGSFCSWFVNDFRRGGKFYAYHADLLPLFEDAGFVVFSIYIVDLGNSFGQIFAQNIFKTKILPKRHEFCLLFQKPK